MIKKANKKNNTEEVVAKCDHLMFKIANCDLRSFDIAFCDIKT